ncbi:MAG: class I SAM-dependent methyltransferase [Gammaproteobacteria bacterium]|jgi:predicted methyltransferase|nr:class I SAM-dependent methyltransferase [Gammaproteobacteria bacterium]MBT5221414.1 class I SAM-dependent methyltransferase [Gammaproteobacteria bacterium]MBT5824679.1 class I SAM-dependent methyltransferase [Gammaproteobacteria bacterium]MBT5966276.1 class I SAM-dependent methyltransferase [Gammaproteobacteria bacterium]MBT6419664.1 class I SAM-dependent methyltransferase [Gammaproteobacteria bacterium]
MSPNNILPRIILLALLMLSFYSAADSGSLQTAINGEHRSKAHQNRDQSRHPEETLAFFGVEPDMTIVEIWPGGKGWYTEILAPYLKDSGLLYVAQFNENSSVSYFSKSFAKFKQKLAAHPDIYGQVIITTLQPPKQLNIAPPGSADRVLTFRNVHNWMKSDQVLQVFEAMYLALKPGGILGVVEHRNAAQTEQDPKAKSGYVTETAVIHLAEQIGFKLLAKSEINANPKDMHDHPKGVWSLPPTFRGGEKNKASFEQIGESDRMTLKFIKP